MNQYWDVRLDSFSRLTLNDKDSLKTKQKSTFLLTFYVVQSMPIIYQKINVPLISS